MSPITRPPSTTADRPRSRGELARPWAFTIGWMALLFVLSAIPGAKYPAVAIRNIDKGVHVCLYTPLGAGFFAVLRGATAMGLGPTWGAAALSATIYGSLDELHQRFVPGRSCDWHDLVADFIGGSIGALALAWRTRRSRRSDRNGQPGLE